MELHINPRFEQLHRKLTAQEEKELEEAIKADGQIIDPIVVMQGDVIVDGHNRYRIGNKLGMNIPVVIRDFEDEDAAASWILQHQLGRRNLSQHDYKMLLGRYYNTEKQSHGGDRRSKGQSGPLNGSDTTNQGSTAERVGQETGVPARTVKRSGQYAAAFDKLPDSVKKLIEADPKKATQQAVLKMAGMTNGELSKIARQVRVGQKATFDEALGSKPAARNGKPKRKTSTRAAPTCRQVFDQIQQRHLADLPNSLDALAEACGGKGKNYEAATEALNAFIRHATEMSKGKR